MGWSLESRAKQSQAIRQWRPWERSTGPKTPEGKARVAANPYKGNWRGELQAMRKALREQIEALRRL
ncbi:transposase [Gammaproteobacteria bacterium]